MDRGKAEFIINSLANFNGVDPDLAISIAEVESHFNELAVRFEANWKYLIHVESLARNSHISQDSERILQMCSWGMMQVMGSVARELGHRGNLLELTRPELGVRYGCLKLKELTKKYSNQEDLIAAYNAGSPRKLDTGKYVNQIYVNKVRGIYAARKMVKP
jgi:soluble lytic murein transglycosylase-like protein